MIQRWRNTGAPFSLPDGRRVGRQEVFEAAATSRVVQMRLHKLRPVAFDTPTSVGGPTDDRAVQFPGIDFGSDKAYELARDNGLSAVDFLGKTGTGQEGAFVKPDVQKILDGE